MFPHEQPENPSPQPGDESAPAIALSELTAGQTGVVLALRGGSGFVNRVASLGFTLGARVTVIENRGRGPLVVSMLGAHLALGRQEAGLIRVRPE